MRAFAVARVAFLGVLAGAGPALAEGDSRAPPTGTGFRLEGQPRIEEPFGDAETFRRAVDRFLALHDEMQELRDDFSRATQEVLRELAPPPPPPVVAGAPPPKPARPAVRRCPEDAIAAPFARASALGQAYLRVGREIARHFDAVKQLDGVGETQALTPDYRWKVKRALELYRQLLVDYREMKTAFHDQLAEEVRFAGCDPDALLARAGKPDGVARDPSGRPYGPPSSAAPRGVPPRGVLPAALGPRDATPVLFYIDNSRCRQPVRVVLDQSGLGTVGGEKRAAFRASSGPHDLCLLSPQSAACGAPGTVRRAYLHDGWTISLRCD